MNQLLDSQINDYFVNTIGLMQGEVPSPILFNLKVNEFAFDFFFNSGCMPYDMSSLNLFLLMHADGIRLFSEPVECLQTLLNELGVIVISGNCV